MQAWLCMSKDGKEASGAISASAIWGEEDSKNLDAQIMGLNNAQLRLRIEMLDGNITVMRTDRMRLEHEMASIGELIKENNAKVKMHKQLPYLVANVIEILDLEPEAPEDGGQVDVTAQRSEKCVVVKTSSRQTVFLPVVGLVEAAKLRPGDIVGVNKDSYLILDMLPAEYDNRVKVSQSAANMGSRFPPDSELPSSFRPPAWPCLLPSHPYPLPSSSPFPRFFPFPIAHPRRWRWMRSPRRTTSTLAGSTSRSRSSRRLLSTL